MKSICNKMRANLIKVSHGSPPSLSNTSSGKYKYSNPFVTCKRACKVIKRGGGLPTSFQKSPNPFQYFHQIQSHTEYNTTWHMSSCNSQQYCMLYALLHTNDHTTIFMLSCATQFIFIFTVALPKFSHSFN